VDNTRLQSRVGRGEGGYRHICGGGCVVYIEPERLQALGAAAAWASSLCSLYHAPSVPLFLRNGTHALHTPRPPPHPTCPGCNCHISGRHAVFHALARSTPPPPDALDSLHGLQSINDIHGSLRRRWRGCINALLMRICGSRRSPLSAILRKDSPA
jgi:hypothetical protein